jgi:hypothetical protein
MTPKTARKAAMPLRTARRGEAKLSIKTLPAEPFVRWRDYLAVNGFLHAAAAPELL